MIDAAKACAYCGEPVLTGSERPEHPIPQALGGSLEVFTVCDPCNTRAGREVDQPFLRDPLVAGYRNLVGQQDVRRADTVVASPFLQGVTAEGDRVTIDNTRQPRLGSRIVRREDGTVQIRVGSDEERDRLLDRERRRAARSGQQVSIVSEERGRTQPRINVSLELDLLIWRRMAAKIGLAVGSIVYPAGWRTSPDARRLRDRMNGVDRTTEDGVAPPLGPTQLPEGAPLAEEDEHLIFFVGGDAGTILGTVFFGTLTVAVLVDTTGAPAPASAWRLHWRGGETRLIATTTEELVGGAAVRLMRTSGDAVEGA